MLNRLGIGKRLTLGFGSIVAILVLAVGIAVPGFQSLNSAFREVRRQDTMVLLAKDAQIHVLQAMAFVGAAAATNDPAARQEDLGIIKAQRTAYMANLEAMKSLAATEETRRMLADLDAAIATARDSNLRLIELAQAGKQAEAIKMYAEVSCPKTLLWNAAFDKLSNRRQMLMAAAQTQTDTLIRRSTWAILLTGLLAVAAAAILGTLITRSVARPVRDLQEVLARVATGDLTVQAREDSQDELGRLGASLNQALQRIRAIILEVSRAALAVSSGATQLSASAEQMSATTQELARNGELLRAATDTVNAATAQFLASVDQVAGNVKDSVDRTGQAVDATRDGSQGTREAADRMARINQATGKISSAVIVIQEIAQQTNLLSLNAAIEAAKAGDQGKGFSVVADEVRKLAERSRAATVEIEKLIQDTQVAVAGGVASVQTTGGLMNRIQDSIGQVSGLVREIGTATREQFSAGAEIAKRMEESAREVSQNAAATHELSATVMEISRTAAELATVSESMAMAVAKLQV
jgi:methyl-accepting chemotaxis protein